MTFLLPRLPEVDEAGLKGAGMARLASGVETHRNSCNLTRQALLLINTDLIAQCSSK